MTRQECENAVLDKLEEIREIIKLYGEEHINPVCLGIGVGSVWLFELERDENDQPIKGKYLLDATKEIDEMEG